MKKLQLSLFKFSIQLNSNLVYQSFKFNLAWKANELLTQTKKPVKKK